MVALEHANGRGLATLTTLSLGHFFDFGSVGLGCSQVHVLVKFFFTETNHSLVLK